MYSNLLSFLNGNCIWFWSLDPCSKIQYFGHEIFASRQNASQGLRYHLLLYSTLIYPKYRFKLLNISKPSKGWALAWEVKLEIITDRPTDRSTIHPIDRHRRSDVSFDHLLTHSIFNGPSASNLTACNENTGLILHNTNTIIIMVSGNIGKT